MVDLKSSEKENTPPEWSQSIEKVTKELTTLTDTFYKKDKVISILTKEVETLTEKQEDIIFEYGLENDQIREYLKQAKLAISNMVREELIKESLLQKQKEDLQKERDEKEKLNSTVAELKNQIWIFRKELTRIKGNLQKSQSEISVLEKMMNTNLLDLCSSFTNEISTEYVTKQNIDEVPTDEITLRVSRIEVDPCSDNALAAGKTSDIKEGHIMEETSGITVTNPIVTTDINNLNINGSGIEELIAKSHKCPQEILATHQAREPEDRKDVVVAINVNEIAMHSEMSKTDLVLANDQFLVADKETDFGIAPIKLIQTTDTSDPDEQENNNLKINDSGIQTLPTISNEFSDDIFSTDLTTELVTTQDGEPKDQKNEAVAAIIDETTEKTMPMEMSKSDVIVVSDDLFVAVTETTSRIAPNDPKQPSDISASDMQKIDNLKINHLGIEALLAKSHKRKDEILATDTLVELGASLAGEAADRKNDTLATNIEEITSEKTTLLEVLKTDTVIANEYSFVVGKETAFGIARKDLIQTISISASDEPEINNLEINDSGIAEKLPAKLNRCLDEILATDMTAKLVFSQDGKTKYEKDDAVATSVDIVTTEKTMFLKMPKSDVVVTNDYSFEAVTETSSRSAPTKLISDELEIINMKINESGDEAFVTKSHIPQNEILATYMNMELLTYQAGAPEDVATISDDEITTRIEIPSVKLKFESDNTSSKPLLAVAETERNTEGILTNRKFIRSIEEITSVAEYTKEIVSPPAHNNTKQSSYKRFNKKRRNSIVFYYSSF